MVFIFIFLSDDYFKKSKSRAAILMGNIQNTFALLYKKNISVDYKVDKLVRISVISIILHTFLNLSLHVDNRAHFA